MKLSRVIATVLLVITAVNVRAQEVNVALKMAFLGLDEEEHLPLSLLDPPIDNFGIPGAELALKENSTTGSFLGHEYSLDTDRVENVESLIARIRASMDAGIRVFIGDLTLEHWQAIEAEGLLEDGLFFNTRARDSILRGQQCHANLLHVAPSRQILADGLAQYLIFKKWSRWLVIRGKQEGDKALVAAYRKAADKFRGEIVEELEWQFDEGSRRTDGGHVNAQREVPLATQTREEYDVLLVADEQDSFGEYLPYLTTKPQLVVGTHGLVVTDWHRVNENWGATQVQRRFTKHAGRVMTARDYAAWVSVRALGEAVTRTGNNDWQVLREFLMAPSFELAAFKGVPVSFRHWNGQLRQPVLLAGPKVLVSVSPQAQFLHERNTLDSLGVDDVESDCAAFIEE